MRLFHSSRWLPLSVLLISSSIIVDSASEALAADEILIAQITPDNTLGNESSVLTPSVDVNGDPADLIEGGATRNSSLFHSFSDFNINTGQRVYFANPAGILDIYSRVTGSTPSSILGTLGVDGGADLFLINPNGVTFGPDSQLDVAGAFTASTAESLVFNNGEVFSAINPDDAPLLKINVTPGLQYGDNTSATITNQGNLAVGQNLTLGAPQLSLSGSLTAGQDIILQGASRQLSDADYIVGGYLFTQTLDGTGVDIVIPHSQVIVANGDVQLDANYEGPSLHILAAGQITQATGVETITVTSGTGGTVTETLADGQTITVSATEQPTVDIRSGVDWLSLAETPPENRNTSGLAVSFGDATGQGIELNSVNTSSSIGEVGGPITLAAAGDIAITGDISSSSYSEIGDATNGGDIVITSISGDITLGGEVNASSEAFFVGRSGDAGNIHISSISGDINLCTGQKQNNLLKTLLLLRLS